MFKKIKKFKDELNQINNLKARRKILETKIKICPECTSELEPMNEQLEWLMPQKYICKKCNYLGTAYFEK
tara:strand:- start:651 stop:860 length:210 start_codon:yes stop_codon:yes gene_type:complete